MVFYRWYYILSTFVKISIKSYFDLSSFWRHWGHLGSCIWQLRGELVFTKTELWWYYTVWWNSPCHHHRRGWCLCPLLIKRSIYTWSLVRLSLWNSTIFHSFVRDLFDTKINKLNAVEHLFALIRTGREEEGQRRSHVRYKWRERVYLQVRSRIELGSRGIWGMEIERSGERKWSGVSLMSQRLMFRLKPSKAMLENKLNNI